MPGQSAAHVAALQGGVGVLAALKMVQIQTTNKYQAAAAAVVILQMLVETQKNPL